MSPSPSPTAEQRRAVELLRSEKRFLLAGHVRPDGDCLGAQAALARVLISLGKQVVIYNPDPPGPEFSRIADPCPFLAFEGGEVPEHDVCVLLDINDLYRCAELAIPLRAAPSRKMIVDHHPHEGEPWWDAAFVDITASATGLLVWRIAQALGVRLDDVAADAVFISLVTDTGWFRYSNTDAETMAVASELIERGVRPAEVYGQLYQQNTASEPKALGAMLQRLEYFAEGRLAVLDQPLSGVGPLVDSDALLDIVRSVGNVEVVLFLKEIEDGICKLSARSKSSYDVNALARRFGGGGHVKASGATIRGKLAEVKDRLIVAAVEGFATAVDGRSKTNGEAG